MNVFKEFEVYATITGFNHYPNAKRLIEGDKIKLCREAENEYDNSAIAVYSEFGKIGYIANNEKTVRKGTMSATGLSELLDGIATAEIVEGGYYEAICKIHDVYDMDKMILKACELYNQGEYADAAVLFFKICEKYNSLLLMQYTADCLIKLDRYDESLAFSVRAIEMEKDNKTSLMMYATALHKLGRYQEAKEAYKNLLEFTENELVKKAFDECMGLSENE